MVKKYNAHLATWMVEMTITDLELSFDEAQHLTMGEINERSLAQHMAQRTPRPINT